MAKQIVCPMMGIFHRRPSPDAPPFAEEGQRVGQDTTIGLVEVMKSFFPVTAGIDGTLTTFLIEDGEFVEPDLPIAEIE